MGVCVHTRARAGARAASKRVWRGLLRLPRSSSGDKRAVDIENTRAVVSIKRQGNFVRSGLDIADEVLQLTLKPILYCKITLLKD